jgi:hypothetical protein
MSLERFTRSSALRTALLLLVGAFTGALAFFAGTAGTVLRESPSRHAGGAVNRALLDLLDLSSYAAAALAFLLVLLLDRVEPLEKVQKGLALRLLAVIAAAAFASHEVITPQMMALRDRLPALIDLLRGRTRGEGVGPAPRVLLRRPPREAPGVDGALRPRLAAPADHRPGAVAAAPTEPADPGIR